MPRHPVPPGATPRPPRPTARRGRRRPPRGQRGRLIGGPTEDDEDRPAPPVTQRPDDHLDPGNAVGVAREGLGTAEAPTGSGGQNEPDRAARDGSGRGLGEHGHDSVACVKHGADTVASMLELAADLLPLLEAGVPVAAVTITRSCAAHRAGWVPHSP